MIKQNKPHFTRLIAVGFLIALFIFLIGVLRARDRSFFQSGVDESKPPETEHRERRAPENLPKTVKRRDDLQRQRWPEGFRLHRYWWVGGAAVYVAEMDRTAATLQFDVQLANEQILGRETVTEVAGRLLAQDVLPLAGVNGSFGIREDNFGRGGTIFNLHIQNRELVSIPTTLDRWGYSPPSAWGETSFGVMPDGEFLMDTVQLNGELRLEGATRETLPILAINQICDSNSPVVLYTPRFGQRTLTRRAYEFILKEIKLPLTGKYTSRFVVEAVNPRGNTPIPPDGVVLAMETRLGRNWMRKLTESTVGTISIALTPQKWQTVQHGIGGNLRLVRDGKVEPELVTFGASHGGSAYRHRNAASRHPRSALGFNDEKLFLIAIDGRQPGYSMGMTLYQMGTFFSQLGIKHAINFDGGSSSTLWALGRVANSPAHGYERRIFNVAMIRAAKE